MPKYSETVSNATIKDCLKGISTTEEIFSKRF